LKAEEPESSNFGEWIFESDVLRSDNKESRLRAQQLHENLYSRGVPAAVTPAPPEQPSSPSIANIQKNIYEKAAPPKRREKPAVQYVKQPWILTIRKEVCLSSHHGSSFHFHFIHSSKSMHFLCNVKP
uniref:Uncharacterized protein n=1 Tax=Parascaris equorum TaxID=6256 RepID=A0A914R1E1_PAREQ